MTEDPELIATKYEAVHKAITEYIDALAPDEHRYTVGWAVEYQFTTTELEREEFTANGCIVKADQLPSTTLGLFIVGADRFRPAFQRR